MKIWKKFVLFTITTISIVLSCSRYYIVKNNFLHAIENASAQNLNQHILEKYMLENEIVKNLQSGEEITDEKIIEYQKSLNSYIGKNSNLSALYNENYEQIYSNIDIKQFDIKSLLSKDQNTYCVKEDDDINYMFFSSCSNINNKILYIISAFDVTSIYNEKDRQLSAILVTDIIVLIASTMTILVFSKYLTNPISILNKTSKKIAKGKFNERVNIKTKDEIGELAESFNTMAGEIENKINELNMQVTQKNDFINGFTHELKTPMTAIMGYTDLLRLKQCDEDLSQKALNYIYSETKRLETLSFKLMKLMSVQEEKLELSEVDIQTLINKVIKFEKNFLDNIEIVVDVEPAKIIGDMELLEVVIRNLVENSKKADPKDNRVLIEGKRCENKYRISVIDKGKGIPKEDIARVTEDFYMVDKTRSRENGGSGIGLSLVKKILNFHKSDVFIESQLNVGTTVYFDLEEVK